VNTTPRSNLSCPLSPSALQHWLSPQKSPPFDAFSSLYGGSAFSATRRYHLPLNLSALCFHGLTKSFSHNSCVFRIICVALGAAFPPSFFATLPANRWPKSRNSRPSSGLPSLFLSCLSFAQAFRLFSIICGLFLLNTGGWGTPFFRKLCATHPALPFVAAPFARCSSTLYPQSRLHPRFPCLIAISSPCDF
jgi:hypothetical protein